MLMGLSVRQKYKSTTLKGLTPHDITTFLLCHWVLMECASLERQTFLGKENALHQGIWTGKCLNHGM